MMLYLAYLGESKKLNIDNDILKLFIVRRPVGKIPDGFMHVPQLSPSVNLFEKTQLWKNRQFNKTEREFLNNKGVLDDEDAWWYLYEVDFRKEIKERPDMVKEIARLKERLKNKEDVYVFCYCKDGERCHRWLVGDEIRQSGYEVDFGKREIPKEPEKESVQLSLFD